MRSKARIQGTYRGAGTTPACSTCGHSRLVVRLFTGQGTKVWVCSEHFKIKGAMKTQSVMDRILKRPVEQEEHALKDVLPNRHARRRHGYGNTRASA